MFPPGSFPLPPPIIGALNSSAQKDYFVESAEEMFLVPSSGHDYIGVEEDLEPAANTSIPWPDEEDEQSFNEL
jgi:hypothetical protein